MAIEPFFISTSEKHFVVTKRYTDILSRTNTDDEDLVQPIPTVIEGFTKFLEEMSIREAPKRSMFHITMTMGEGFSVGVKGYGLVVEQKKITPKQFVDVDGELKEALSKTVYFAEVRNLAPRDARWADGLLGFSGGTDAWTSRLWNVVDLGTARVDREFSLSGRGICHSRRKPKSDRIACSSERYHMLSFNQFDGYAELLYR